MLQRWLLAWLVLISAVAYAWPATVFDPFVASQPYLAHLIAVTMFAIGSLLPRDEIAQVARRWPTVLGGTAIQYTAMPLLAFAVGHLFRLERDALIGLIMVGCVPGAMASNVLTLAARGNVSYSVSLTTSATLLSPLVVPFALSLFLGATTKIDPVEVSRMLVERVVGPVVAGHLLSRYVSGFERIARRLGPLVANLTILWIIAAVVGLNRERLGTSVLTVLAPLVTLNLLGYTAGSLGGRVIRLTEPMRRALTLEVGMQNAGLGSTLVLDLFPENPQAAVPTAAYTFGCMLTGTMLAAWWAGREPQQDEHRETADSLV